MPFTAEEEAARDAVEAAWDADAPNRSRVVKFAELDTEYERRISFEVPQLASAQIVNAFVEFWKSLAVAAKNPTAGFNAVIAIQAAYADAIATLDAETDPAVIDAFDVAVDPNWP